MKTGAAGIALIRYFEGFSATPYYCPAGYLTVGYGHLMRSEEILSFPINREVAEQLLRRDLVSAEKAVARYISIRLLQHQFDALVSFTFNLGSGALQRSTLRRKINSGYLEEAQEEFIKWVWASGRQLKGLISRRKAEAALFGGDLSDFLRFRNKTAILP